MNNPIEELREMNLQDVYKKMQFTDEELATDLLLCDYSLSSETSIFYIKTKNFDFRFNTSTLNQGQERIFTYRECAHSIRRIEKSL